MVCLTFIPETEARAEPRHVPLNRLPRQHEDPASENHSLSRVTMLKSLVYIIMTPIRQNLA